MSTSAPVRCIVRIDSDEREVAWLDPPRAAAVAGRLVGWRVTLDSDVDRERP